MAMVDEYDDATADDVIETVPAKDNDGIPYCRKHHCRMKRASGGKKGSPTVYYSCAVAGCDERGQKVKVPNERIVPTAPLACPRCSKDGKPVYAERDQKNSTAMAVVLKCPSCGWKSNAMAAPQFAAMQSSRRNGMPSANIGDR